MRVYRAAGNLELATSIPSTQPLHPLAERYPSRHPLALYPQRRRYSLALKPWPRRPWLPPCLRASLGKQPLKSTGINRRKETKIDVRMRPHCPELWRGRPAYSGNEFKFIARPGAAVATACCSLVGERGEFIISRASFPAFLFATLQST